MAGNVTLGSRVNKNYVYNESAKIWVPQPLSTTAISTLVDGADVTQGAIADASVAAGAAGTVSAKLRRLTTDLDALLTELKVKADPTETQLTSNANIDVALSTRLKPADTLAAVTAVGSISNALPAGTNLMGKVGIDQTTPGTTNGIVAKFWDAVTSAVKSISFFGDGVFAVCQPYLYSVAEGDIAGHDHWSLMGFNPTVTTEECITGAGGAYVFPAAEQHMHVFGGAQDDVGGTGIQVITIAYLDDAFAEHTVDVTMTGAVASETTATDIYRIQHVYAKTVGTGKVASGAITIMDHGETITYGGIAAGQTRSRQAVWTVPAGLTLYVVTMHVSAVHTAVNNYAIITLRATYNDLEDATATFFMPYAETIIESGGIALSFPTPNKFIAGTDIIVVGASTGTAAAAVVLRGWIE